MTAILLRRLALVLGVALAATTATTAQEVVTGLSTDNIALTANFDGSEIFVFGAIRRSGAERAEGPLDIVITLKGPVRPVRVRRKERRFGLWVNTDSVVVRQVPTFYAVATTRPLATVLSETERLRHGIGLDQAVRRVGGHHTISDTRPFGTAVVRLRLDNGLYTALDGAVRITEDTLFQTHIQLPANLTEGEYAAEFFLVRNRAVIDSGGTTVRVEKTGIERWLYNLAQQRPLAYGVFAVALALFAGWLAAAIFGLVRR